MQTGIGVAAVLSAVMGLLPKIGVVALVVAVIVVALVIYSRHSE